MAQTYAQLQEQISKLQDEALKLKKAEFSSIVLSIQESIRLYGIQPQDLFGRRLGKAATVRTGTGAVAGPGVSKTYTDGRGNVWGGRGPRPLWLREAIASGRTLDDFIVGKPHSAASAPSAKPAKPVVATLAKKMTGKTAAVKKATATAKKATVKKVAGKKAAARSEDGKIVPAGDNTEATGS